MSAAPIAFSENDRSNAGNAFDFHLLSDKDAHPHIEKS